MALIEVKGIDIFQALMRRDTDTEEGMLAQHERNPPTPLAKLASTPWDLPSLGNFNFGGENFQADVLQERIDCNQLALVSTPQHEEIVVPSKIDDEKGRNGLALQHPWEQRVDEFSATLQQVQIHDLDQLPSQGSALHSVGGCTPCVRWAKKRCTWGVYCKACHIPHEGMPRSNKNRPSKAKRERRDELRKDMEAFFEIQRSYCKEAVREVKDGNDSRIVVARMAL